jgi:hypothetical protein
MLENWLSCVERGVFRGGCFFAAASAEFDSRPGAVREQIAELTNAWMVALREEIEFAQSKGEIPGSIKPTQLAFELHAYVQEANWAFKLFNDMTSLPSCLPGARSRPASMTRLLNESARKPSDKEHIYGSNIGRMSGTLEERAHLQCSVLRYLRCSSADCQSLTGEVLRASGQGQSGPRGH